MAKYSKQDEIRKLASSYLYESVVMKELDSIEEDAAFAYCTRVSGSNIYRIVRNFFAKSPMYFMHEFGHMYFGHMEYNEIKEAEILEMLEKNEKIVEKHIITNDYGSIKTKVFKKLAHELLNIAMDFQVNSTFFTVDEEKQMIKDMTQTHYWILSKKSKYQAQAFFHNYSRDPEQYCVRPMLVTDYKYPRKLSYREYISLMFVELDKFLHNYVVLVYKSRTGKMKGEGFVTTAPAGLLEESFESEDGSEGEPNDKPGIGSDQENEGRGKGSDGHSGTIKEVKPAELFTEARNFILKNSIVHITNKSTDPLYNYNRGKSRDVMIEKKREHTNLIKGNIYCLVDVSGSVNKESVNRITSTFKEIKNQVGSKSKVIYWDSDLCKMVPFKTLKGNECPSGSSTNIDRGIDYIVENLSNKKEDKIFVISDFCDNLNAWKNSISKFKGTTFGIQYINGYTTETIEKDLGKDTMKAILKIEDQKR